MGPVTTRPAPRQPRRDAAENREALIAAARAALNRDPGASLESIAKAAGLSRRSIYGHFSNRDELLLELVTSGSRRVAAALETVSHSDPLTRLALIASHLWIEVESVRVIALVALRGPLASHTLDALGPIRQNVREAIRDGQANSTMRRDIPVDRLARLVESTALSVLEESTAHAIEADEGHRLVMLMTLGAVGLGWRESQTFIAETPELSWRGE
jgi:AcrR family transcriptional regulator